MKILSRLFATKFTYKKRSEDQGCHVKNYLDLIFAVELRPPAALLLGEATAGGVEAEKAKQGTHFEKLCQKNTFM